MANQYPELLTRSREHIAVVAARFALGGRPSDVANLLHTRGVGDIQMMVIFKQVVGAALGDLKAFGQWWGEDGVTDPSAFDAWAAVVWEKNGIAPKWNIEVDAAPETIERPRAGG